ncbi:MAG: MFS transporter [Verrucomicrobiota bacterium]
MSNAVPDPEVTKLTFRLEKWRAANLGVLETALSTFLVLIAIRVYEADAGIKAFLVGGYSLGLLVGPLVVFLVSKGQYRASSAAAAFSALGGTGFLLAAFGPGLESYVAGSIIGTAAMTASIPLVIQITHDNYPAHKRGYLFSKTALIRIMVAAIFGDIAGRFLTGNYEAFPWVLAAYALALYLGAWLLMRIPSSPIAAGRQPMPWKSLQILRDDRAFRNLLIAWFVMGFGNLMMFAVRVEYVGNPVHGIRLSALEVAFLTAVVPSVARLLSSTFWGKLFDRMDFFLLRIVLNVVFAVAILCYFLTTNLFMLVFGSILFGIARGGGEIAWSLWVTKFARPENVADYMAVHTFLTGVRAFTAPFVAFYALGIMSMQSLAWIGFGLTAISCFMIFPQMGPSQPIQDDETLSEQGVTE